MSPARRHPAVLLVGFLLLGVIGFLVWRFERSKADLHQLQVKLEASRILTGQQLLESVGNFHEYELDKNNQPVKKVNLEAENIHLRRYLNALEEKNKRSSEDYKKLAAELKSPSWPPTAFLLTGKIWVKEISLQEERMRFLAWFRRSDEKHYDGFFLPLDDYELPTPPPPRCRRNHR